MHYWHNWPERLNPGGSSTPVPELKPGDNSWTIERQFSNGELALVHQKIPHSEAPIPVPEEYPDVDLIRPEEFSDEYHIPLPAVAERCTEVIDKPFYGSYEWEPGSRELAYRPKTQLGINWEHKTHVYRRDASGNLKLHKVHALDSLTFASEDRREFCLVAIHLAWG